MAPLAERLTDDLTMLALCWRIVRADGVALGFTTHDRALAIAGLTHDSVPGITPSAVVISDGLEVDMMDIAGALTSSAITRSDLHSRRYDGAAVELFIVDWRAPEAGRQSLAKGVLGNVEIGIGPDAGFSAAIRGLTSRLLVPLVASYSPECRAELGDDRCRVDLRGRRHRGTVLACDGDRVSVSGVGADPAELAQGWLRVLTGGFAGLDRRIIAADFDALVLDEPLAITTGVLVEVTEGCDQRFATCAGRFGNALNFRGEPHVPGADVLTRFGVG